MSNQYRATPEQWAKCEELAHMESGAYRCLLELRARVEVLEATQRATPMDELRAASAEARPGELVERVLDAIRKGIAATHPADEPARAAIRAVAAWLRMGRLLHAAELLELEVDRG